ncbi:MAG: GE37468 family thiazolyl peptide [Pseudonocardiales bacterium]|nr:MAG: GE37468 family thiazolyl peptide [Pseudonocardiales bacterium]
MLVGPDVADLPLDVFELENEGFAVESLTADHGFTMPDGRLSTKTFGFCCNCCVVCDGP